MTKLSFPGDFVWGVATSAYQIEGAATEDGRGESIWDRFCATPEKVIDGSSGAVACDHYHRYREDVALMKELGLQAYRFSIAWPRILPAGRGAVNEKGLDFYSRLVDTLLGAGIEPFPTLFHWDLPQALQDEGGWPARATAEAFAEYADVISRHLGDRVKNWITHNEPWCASMLGYRDGVHAPGIEDYAQAIAASHHLLLSHGLAVPILRANSPGADVGITLNLAPMSPASPSAADREAWRHRDGNFNRWFLDPCYGRGYPDDMVRDYIALGALPPQGMTMVEPGDLDAIAAPTDFLGVNYYYRWVCRSEEIPEEDNEPRTVFQAPESEWTEMEWEVYPKGLWEITSRVHQVYQPTKLYITECGASYMTGPDGDGRVRDELRRVFLRDHFAQSRRCIDDEIPLQGFFVWSMLDNFEWARGYEQRFGIVWVDYESQDRILKDSALFYRDVIADNAVDTEG